jgi:alpha-glucosidase
MTGSERAPWWRDAVLYEVYLRSFADGNGDGIGDLPGLRSRLPYLRDLGVDGIWITPWYPSPMKDGGYDVRDYTDIEPLFGTLDDARMLLEDAHRLGLKVIVDFVANHTSDEHRWFRQALAAAPGSPVRDRYHFRDGKGPEGDQPPNDWISAFGGPAWTRVSEPDGIPGQWYLHLFAPAQPDLNWDNPEVRTEFEAILRFWFDFGLDGLRLDAASGLAKDPALADFGFLAEDLFQPVTWTGSPLWDVEGVHDILRSWRRIADEYPGDRMFVGEVVVNGAERLARYMRPDELHTTFNLDFLKSPLDAGQLRRTIDGPVPPPWPPPVSDLALGTRRARAMLLMMLALPGSVYLYQARSSAAEAEAAAEDSMLTFYRRALAARRQHLAPADSGPSWLESRSGVLAFDRGPGLRCIVNLSSSPYPFTGDVLIGSESAIGSEVLPDTAAWIRTGG